MPVKNFSGRNDKYNSRMTAVEFMAGVMQQSKSGYQMERQTRHIKNWRTYYGLDLNRDTMTMTVAGPEKGQTAAKINYPQVMINKTNSFCFGKPWQLTLDFPPLSLADRKSQAIEFKLPEAVATERETMSSMVRFVDDVFMKDNPGDSLRLEAGLYAGVTGTAILVVSPVGQDENLAESLLKVTVIDPLFVETVMGPDNRTIIQATIKYPTNLDVDGQITDETQIFEQVITPEEVTETYYDREGRTIGQPNVKPNPIKTVFVIAIKNMPGPGTEGLDDISALRGLNDELNDKISDISDIIDYHSAPTTVIFGARANALEKGANKVWSGLPKDAKVENLKLEGDLPAANNHTKELRNMIKEASGVNDMMLGSSVAVSNTSGVALQMLMYPMSSLSLLKWAEWEPAVRRLAELILMWGKTLKQIQYDDGMLRKFMRTLDILFYSNLPKDELLEIQKNTEKVNAGISSRQEAIAALGHKDPEGALAQIEREKEQFPLTSATQPNPLSANTVAEKPAGDKNGSTGSNLSGVRNSTEANPQ